MQPRCILIRLDRFYCELVFVAGDDYVQVINSDQEVGTSPHVFSVQILEDDLDEPPEVFNLVLSSIRRDVLINANSSTAVVTITDDSGKFSIGGCCDPTSIVSFTDLKLYTSDNGLNFEHIP